MKKVSRFSRLACIVAFTLGMTHSSFAAEVKGITFVNDEECYAKVALEFVSIDGLAIKAHNIELCDDDGGFTTVLLYRAIQSFAQKYPAEQVNWLTMKEWAHLQHSFFATLDFFTKKLKFFAERGHYDQSYSALRRELNAEKIRLEQTINESLPKFSYFVPVGKILNEHLSGLKPKSSLFYKYFYLGNSESLAMKDFKINDANFSIPLKNKKDKKELVYKISSETLFEQFESACQKFRKLPPSIGPLGSHVEIMADYVTSFDNQLHSCAFHINIPAFSGAVSVSDQEMYKTVAVKNLSDAMRAALEKHETNPQEAAQELRLNILCLENMLVDYAHVMKGLNTGKTKTWSELVALAYKLANNLETKKDERVLSMASYGFSSRGMTAKGMSYESVGGSYNISSGGAQSAGKAWSTIQKGGIPSLDDFNIGGLLKEFDLSLAPPRCEAGEVCFGSGIAYDPKRAKLLVQMTMNINPNEDQLIRKPANVAILVDISASMSSQEDESSRIDWAKKAVTRLLSEQLNKGDLVSIHAFDHEVETILEPTPLTPEVATKFLENKLPALAPRGATDLGLALEKGYASVKSQQLELGLDQKNYQSLVILISDAQANTGETSKAGLHAIVQHGALENVALIAIGIGSASGFDKGFDQSLINAITQTKGGSYDFATSEQDMDRTIDKMPFLMNPIAYNLKAKVNVDGARLFRVYGTAADENSVPSNSNILSIPTLVLTKSESGGGATILEYDLQKTIALTSNQCTGPVCIMSLKIIGNDSQERHFSVGQSVKFNTNGSAVFNTGKISKVNAKTVVIKVNIAQDKTTKITLSTENAAHLEVLQSLRVL